MTETATFTPSAPTTEEEVDIVGTDDRPTEKESADKEAAAANALFASLTAPNSHVDPNQTPQASTGTGSKDGGGAAGGTSDNKQKQPQKFCGRTKPSSRRIKRSRKLTSARNSWRKWTRGRSARKSTAAAARENGRGQGARGRNGRG
jgi:hypothetical protein